MSSIEEAPAERTAERVKKGLWVGVKGAVRVLDCGSRQGAQASAGELAGVGASGPAPGSDLDDEIPF